jgi:hypothetical protein
MCSKIRPHAAGNFRKTTLTCSATASMHAPAGIYRCDTKTKREVLSGKSDEEVLDWCLANGRLLTDEQVLIYNSFMSKRGRTNGSKSPEGQKRMMAEADFAFRQAFALCPYSPEAIFRYVNLLVSGGQIEDAFRVAGTAQFLNPDNSQLENLVSELSRLKRAQGK